MRAVCLHCFRMSLIWDEGPIEYMFSGNKEEVDKWVKAHKSECEGNIVFDFPQKTILE